METSAYKSLVIIGIQFKMHEKIAVLINYLRQQIHFLLLYGALFPASGHPANSRRNKDQAAGMKYSVHGHSLFSSTHSHRKNGKARKNGRKIE